MIELAVAKTLRSILRDSGPVPAPRGTIASDEPPELVAYDYSEVDEDNDNDLRRRRDKQFLMEGAKSLTHLCIHLPENPYCIWCMSYGKSKTKTSPKR